jgi:hypothetical protein
MLKKDSNIIKEKETKTKEFSLNKSYIKMKDLLTTEEQKNIDEELKKTEDNFNTFSAY